MEKENILNWIDLSDITENEAIEQYVDYRITVLNPGYGDPLFKYNNQYIKESTEISLPLDTVRKSIIKKYNLLSWQFQIKKMFNDIDVGIVIPVKGMNEQYIIDDMNHCGYFVSQKEETRLHGLLYRIYRFEPFCQNSIKNEIKTMGCILHISPECNFENIKLNGFIPQHKNNAFLYPDRVYYIKGTVSIYEIRELGEMLYNVDKQTNKSNFGDYIIYWLDTNLIPDNVDFFFDPNYEEGIFTYDKIPYSAVISTQNICFNRLREKYKSRE